jgi:hypothetical protein
MSRYTGSTLNVFHLLNKSVGASKLFYGDRMGIFNIMIQELTKIITYNLLCDDTRRFNIRETPIYLVLGTTFK